MFFQINFLIALQPRVSNPHSVKQKLWLMLDDDAEDNDGADNNIDVPAMMIDNQLMICNDDDYVLNC